MLSTSFAMLSLVYFVLAVWSAFARDYVLCITMLIGLSAHFIASHKLDEQKDSINFFEAIAYLRSGFYEIHILIGAFLLSLVGLIAFTTIRSWSFVMMFVILNFIFYNWIISDLRKDLRH